MAAMRISLILIALLLVSTSLAACGQRVAPRAPADKVEDSMSY